MDRRWAGGQMAIKVDIRKAFDTVEWPFLLEVLRCFGFSAKFRDWVKVLLASSRISILFDGIPHGYFACSKGVRQGDPLSPLLFCFAEEYFSRGLLRMVDQGELQPAYCSKAVPLSTHLLYADDVLLSCKATQSNARNIVRFLDHYGSLSGQRVNYDKSSVYFGRTVGRHSITSLNHILRMKVGSLPFVYLGVPLFSGVPRRTHLQQLYDKVIARFSSWTKLLSQAGRAMLIRSVISGMLIHSFAVYRWPALLLQSLEKCIRNFLWTGMATTRKLVTVSWKKTCATLNEGGLGIRSLKANNKAMLSKLAWSILEGSTPILSPLRARFITPAGTARTAYYKSTIWSSIRDIFTCLLAETIWLVGEHSVVKFWTMNWLGYIIRDRVDADHIEDLGAVVSDFFVDGVWYLPESLESYYADICGDIRTIQMIRGGPDRVVWKNRQSGSVTCRAAYDQFSCHFPEVSWGKWLWAQYILPRRSFLVWQVVHEALSTQTLLQKRGVTLVSACPLCLSHSETIDHVFLECNFGRSIWTYFLQRLDIDLRLDCGVNGIILRLMDWHCSKGAKAILKALLCAIISEIWYARNLLYHQNQRLPQHTVVGRIWNAVHNLALFKFGVVHNNQFDLKLLWYFKLKGCFQRPKLVKEVWWNGPTSGWTKVNIDGSAGDGDGRLVSGGVFRNSRGFFKFAFAGTGGYGHAYEAEILAFILAIELAVANQWTKLWVESDSALVVHLVRTKSASVPWHLLVRWLNCLHHLHRFDFVISHIYREGNQAADALTKLQVEDTVTWTSCPNFLWPFICRDLQGKPFFRFT